MFAGKVIAITGASEGIGAELARQLAGKGVWLALATDIRLHGYGPDGGQAGKSGLKEDKAMPVQECARQILAATHSRKRELVMTLQGRIGLWLKLIAPGMVDRMIMKAVNKNS